MMIWNKNCGVDKRKKVIKDGEAANFIFLCNMSYEVQISLYQVQKNLNEVKNSPYGKGSNKRMGREHYKHYKLLGIQTPGLTGIHDILLYK